VSLVKVWRSVRTVLASVKTRLMEWTLVRKTKLRDKERREGKFDVRLHVAIMMAEQRMTDATDAHSPAHLGKLAVRASWSNLRDALAPAPKGPGTAASPPCTLAPA
jgi:hypothetical protein